MKKRFLSIVLTLCMVLLFVPTTVFAESVGDEYAFLAVLQKGGTQKLDKDYYVAKSINVGKSITLDLNGHVVRFEAGEAWLSVDRNGDNVTLTIKDSKPNEKHTGENAGLPDGGVLTGGYNSYVKGGCFHICSTGTLILEGGTLYGFSSDFGGAVANYGKFIMTGGTIQNCSATDRGGAVANFENGTFTMSDGTIDNCSAKIFGGAVYNHDTSKSIIEGGTIQKCSADYGGGVFINNGSFTMTGGTIQKCVATTSVGSYGFGGGVNIYYGNFTMNGGTIQDCAATYDKSSSVCLFANATMVANGGSIHGSSSLDSLDGTTCTVQTTSSDGYTKFYDVVENEGVISGGVYYGGIQNKYDGTVTGTCYTVSFDLNGGDGSIPTQWFVNTNKAPALKPANPTRDGYVFMGWYSGNVKYNFLQSVTKSITLTAKWVSSNVSNETELKQAIDAGIPSIKLVNDITLSSTLDLSDKDITVDLNGHVLHGDIKLSDSINPTTPSKLILIDSNPTAAHTDSNLPLGGVLDGEMRLDKKTLGVASLLYANGGTITGQVVLNDSTSQIVCTSATPTVFMGYVGGLGEIHGGVFYGGISENRIKENAVTFITDGSLYAVNVVASGTRVTIPIEPVKDGYLFGGWYIGNTKYDFTQMPIGNITLTAKWVNEVTTEDTLRAAIDAGISSIKLMDDFNLSSILDLSDKEITLDLNGHTLTGSIKLADTSAAPDSVLTLIDSDPVAGGVLNGNITLTRGNGSTSHLYANGGTVTGQVSMPSYAGGIFCTSDTPTIFKGYVGNYGEVHGGIFYGNINTDCIREKTVTFMNGDSRYALEVVADGKKVAEPVAPSIKNGYQTFDGWYNGNTKYTFGSALSEDITLTAKFGNPYTYKITYHLDSGTATPANPTSYTVESEAIMLNNPTKTGYTFTGWNGTGLNGNNNKTVTIPKGSTGDRIYTANYSQNSYTVTFDTDGGNAISDKTGVKWTDKVLDSITNPTKNGWEFTGWKCGNLNVTAGTTYSDLAVNDTVASITLVAQWKDIKNPVITGLENGKTYCEAVEFEVSDNDGIASVKAGNEVLEVGSNGKYTLAAGVGTVTVVVTDNTGGTENVTVTVNNGHTYEWQSENGKYWKKCKFCDDETAKKDIPTITINGADAVCVTQEYKFSFTLPEGATDASYGYEFENKGDSELPAIIENNELFGVVPVIVYEPSENTFKVSAGAKTADGFEFYVSKTVALNSEHTDAAPKDHVCDVCGATLSEHTGGEATCMGKAICEYCGKEYGNVDSSNHNLENIPAKAATVTETGNKEYWHCKDCENNFSDKDGKNSIELADTVTQKLPPEIIEGKGQSITAGEKKELTFRSNAALGDFIRVELDGKTLDEKNYTVKEGSTVVTLKADYVATLSAGEHTIGIVSESGTATTTFTVNANTVVDNDTKSPQSGDNSHMALWIALLFVSGGALIGTAAISKKRKCSAR